MLLQGYSSLWWVWCVCLQVLRTISTIKTSGSRLLNLVNDILDAASMRKGKLAVKHEKVDLHKIVEDVVELTTPLVSQLR
jgi:signal transduction histidine kinase